MVLMLGFSVSASLSGTARAASCSNEQVRVQQVYALRLPDCRAYEQVSPTEKNLINAVGHPGIVQSSPSDNSASEVRVSFYSAVPFPASPGAGTEPPTYLGMRGSGDGTWSTLGIQPPAAPSSQESKIVGLTEDLAKTIVRSEEPPLAPGAIPNAQNVYVRDNATGIYQLLAGGLKLEPLYFADSALGGARILFETEEQLPTTNAAPAPGATNLYEWDESQPPGERVSLVGVLPDGESAEKGSVAGPGGPAVKALNARVPGGSTSEYYTQDTISEDGSRVWFTDVKTGIIYLREPVVERTIPISAGAAFWRAATPDGRYVFYTEGQELYRFNVDRFEESGEPESQALAEARESLTAGAEGVEGVMGISSDGSYAYFVAPGKLTVGENGNHEEAKAGAYNLYEWHEGSPVAFIVRLGSTEAFNWLGYAWTGGLKWKTSRVTPGGKTILFQSSARLTSYNNNSLAELYLYDADSGSLKCVSCNPDGSPPGNGAGLTEPNPNDLPLLPRHRNAFLTRNLSDDGDRVFFETKESLLSEDANSQGDVYEWEREGVGSCASTSQSFSASSEGCLYLISTGRSSAKSYFGDASAFGNDVFFFTRQSLVGQDRDNNMDIYDARVNGGIAGQNPMPPPAPCGEGTCHGTEGIPPVFGASPSTALAGNGNLAPVEIKPATKHKVKAKKRKRRRVKTKGRKAERSSIAGRGAGRRRSHS